MLTAFFELFDPAHAGADEPLHLGLREGREFFFFVINQAEVFHFRLRMTVERRLSTDSRSAESQIDKGNSRAARFLERKARAIVTLCIGTCYVNLVVLPGGAGETGARVLAA